MNINRLSVPDLKHSRLTQQMITIRYKSDKRRMVVLNHLVSIPLRPINLSSMDLLGTWFNETNDERCSTIY